MFKKRPKASTTNITASFTREQRALLNVNKASVNTIRVGALSTTTTTTTINRRAPITEEISNTMEDFVVQKELAVFKRLTRFRRRQVKRDTQVQFQNVIMERESSSSVVFSTGLKCRYIQNLSMLLFKL